MTTLLQDVRYGFRMLLKAPGFTLVAALTLALGIGANTAIFSVINAALLRALPVREPQQLVVIGDPARVHSNSTGSPRADLFSVPLYEEMERQQDAFQGLAATGHFGPAPRVSVAANGGSEERAQARVVSENFFAVLGIDAAMGRVFRAEDGGKPGGDPVVVISHAFWKERLGSDPGVIGRTLRVNGFPLNVIGVMPSYFTGEVVGDSVSLWVPLGMQEQVMPGDARLNDVEHSWLLMIGRLKPGVSLEQARARTQVIYERIAQSGFASRFEPDNQAELRKVKLIIGPGARGLSGFREEFSQPLMALMGIVGLVLLIACVNVANLMLARSAARRKEISVRLAIGASNGRIVRQLLTESVLLSLVGGGLGLLFAQWGTHMLLAIARSGQPVPLDAGADPLVLAFTFGVCVLTGVLFGLAPALRSRRVELTEALNSSTRGEAAGASRWSAGRLLVGGQVALSLVVVFSGGLLVHSLRNLQAVNTGYERQHLLLLRLNPRTVGYDGAGYIAFCNQLLDRLRALPGVLSATYSENGLFSGSESGYSVEVPGFEKSSARDRTALGDTVGPNYFTAIGIPLLEGRDIGPQDLGGIPKVVVINETMAKFYFRGEDPIGRTFRIHSPEYQNTPLQVVGIARDVHDHNLDRPVSRRLYLPVGQPNLPAENVFEMRTAQDPASLEPAVRQAVSAANPQLAVTELSTEDQLVNDSLQERTFIAQLSAFFAGLALLLACVGLYGITSYAVAGRTREIGVRIALGAEPRRVVWLVLREGMALIGMGMLVGVPAAIAAARLLHSMVFEVSALDPRSLGGALGALLAVGLVAAYVPARRAAKVDPMVALRYE